MIRLDVTVSDGGLRDRLRKLLRTVRDKRKLLDAAGHTMMANELPLVFREGRGWPLPRYRRGEPLRDTGRLQRSISYRTTKDELVIGTPLVYARLQQEGGTVTPVRRKWLAIPLSPPLSESERRAKRPKDFPGAFVLMRGPEGPGIYRKSRTARSVNLRTRKTSYAGRTKGIERIFALVKSVRLPKRRFLFWSDRALERIRQLWIRMMAEGVR